jgi:hypothetical protein
VAPGVLADPGIEPSEDAKQRVLQAASAARHRGYGSTEFLSGFQACFIQEFERGQTVDQIFDDLRESYEGGDAPRSC